MPARGKYQCPYCSRQNFANKKEWLAHVARHREQKDKMRYPGYVAKRRSGKFL